MKRISPKMLTYRKIDTSYSVNDDEDICVCQFCKAIIQSHWEHKDKHLQVKIK